MNAGERRKHVEAGRGETRPVRERKQSTISLRHFTTPRYGDVNGAHIAYEVAGDGYPSVPLVLIHAGIADMRMWDDLFPVSARRYRNLRYDLRGFGRSNMPPGPYSHADDLAALLAHLAIERAYLLGASLGGQMALDFTLEHPDRVAALITSGTKGCTQRLPVSVHAIRR